MKNSESPLKVEVTDGKLIISIGIQTLAWVVSYEGNLMEKFYPNNYKVTDALGFAEDVAEKLEHEDEIGDTVVTELLDTAIIEAINDGSCNVEEVGMKEGE